MYRQYRCLLWSWWWGPFRGFLQLHVVSHRYVIQKISGESRTQNGGGGISGVWGVLEMRACHKAHSSFHLQRGDGRGGVFALALPHHVHTRDKHTHGTKITKRTLSCLIGAQRHRALLKTLLGPRREIWDNWSSCFYAAIKKKEGGCGKGGGACELEILLHRSRLFHGKFLEVGGGRISNFLGLMSFFHPRP